MKTKKCRRVKGKERKIEEVCRKDDLRSKEKDMSKEKEGKVKAKRNDTGDIRVI